MLDRFDARDRRFVFGCLAVALVCGAVALRYFGRAFPEASIQFTVNRTESAAVANSYLAASDHSTDGYKHAVTFDFDDETKTYLERRLGLERAQEIYGHQVRLWRWSHRWFKPQQKEELHVDVTAGGEVASFSHLLPEEASGASLEADSARVLAENFLTGRMHLALAEWDFVEGASTRQPNRVDHTFTWKKKDFDVGDPDATYRATVTVAGNRIARYDEFLDIPQAWQDDYAKLRAKNDTAAIVALLFLLLTWLAMLISLVLRIRDHDVRWPVVLGFGLVGFALNFFATLNQFDLEKFGYDTTDSYASFYTQFLLRAVLGALGSGGFILLLTAAAEPIYRERFPDKLALSSLFTRQGLRTKRFFREVLLGLTLMLFFAAYQSVFYVVAARAGAWAPLDVPYNNLLGTAIPWALILFIGFFPAVSEEFTSRMFSVPFLDKHLARIGLSRRTALALAIVVSSFVWGFAHSNYPNQPYWIRGVEVGVAGVLVSIVMLRWGILATLVWHYTVDAFYTSLLMLRSGNPYFLVSGSITAGIMLVPLVAAMILYWRRGGFEPERGLLNRDAIAAPPPALLEPGSGADFAAAPAPLPEAVPAAVEPAAIAARPVPLTRYLVGAAIAAVLLALYFVPAVEPGKGIEVQSRRDEALASARAHLRDCGADPAHYRTDIQMLSRFEPEVGRYVLERTSLEKLNAIHATYLRTPVWRVRFYRAGEREEYRFNLPVNAPTAPPDSVPMRAGATAIIPLWAFEHTIPDSAAGDTLGIDAAQLLASDFLRGQGVEPADLDLKESRSERQKARTDHTFEWQVPDSTLGDAGVRYMVIVRGGEVAALRPYMHLPEAWLRADRERSVLQQILVVLSRGVVFAALLGVVVLFVLAVRARRFPWTPALKWGVVGAVLSLVLMALRWHSDVTMRYDTSIPYRLFLVTASVGLVIQMLLIGLLVAMLVGTVLAVRPETRQLWTGGWDRRSARDAILLAILGIGLEIGLRRLGVVLTALDPRHANIDDLLVLASAARPLPWLDLFLDQIRTNLLLLPTIAALLYLATRQLGIVRSLVILGAAVLLFAAEGARTPAAFGLQLAMGAASAGLAVFVLAYLFRDRDLAYVLAFFGGRGLGAAATWIQQPEASIRTTGIILATLLGALLVTIVWWATRRTAGRRSDVG